MPFKKKKTNEITSNDLFMSKPAESDYSLFDNVNFSDLSKDLEPQEKKVDLYDPESYKRREMTQIDIRLISENPHQPRKYFDEEKLDELTDSIHQEGIIQPLAVRLDQNTNTIHLVAGERRLRAAKKAGFETVPVVLIDNDPAIISLIENVQRENLNPVEEAIAYQKLIDEKKCSQEELAGIVGKSRTTITNSLAINRLPEIIKSECLENDWISKQQLIEVARMPHEDDMFAVFEEIKNSKGVGIDLKRLRKRKLSPKRGPQGKSSRVQKVTGKLIVMRKYLNRLGNNTKLTFEEKSQIKKDVEKLKSDVVKLLERLDDF